MRESDERAALIKSCTAASSGCTCVEKSSHWKGADLLTRSTKHNTVDELEGGRLTDLRDASVKQDYLSGKLAYFRSGWGYYRTLLMMGTSRQVYAERKQLSNL